MITRWSQHHGQGGLVSSSLHRWDAEGSSWHLAHVPAEAEVEVANHRGGGKNAFVSWLMLSGVLPQGAGRTCSIHVGTRWVSLRHIFNQAWREAL